METVRAAVGYAADSAGNGVAYARITVPRGSPRVLRVNFRVKRQPALLDREVGYAALSALCEAVRRKGFESVRLCIDDAQLASDLRNRDVPPPLVLPYVRLGCALNQFRRYEIAALEPADADLAARARSEAALYVAA